MKFLLYLLNFFYLIRFYTSTKITPKDAHVWVNLARAYKATKDIKNAKAAFIKAQKLDPA
ncbi:hypothetical protein KJ680_06615, partial [bacterium]|nr:hypothetical protein [bacterium]